MILNKELKRVSTYNDDTPELPEIHARLLEECYSLFRNDPDW